MLAAVVVWGVLGAISAEAFQQPAKPDPKAEAKDDEPRYEFAISGKPWKDVFAWLNEKTGLPIVGVAIPTGTLNLFVKADKKYTMSEVIDLINEGLLSNEDKQQFYLIRRERNFVLVAADQKIDPALAPLVNLVDLKKHAKTPDDHDRSAADGTRGRRGEGRGGQDAQPVRQCGGDEAQLAAHRR